MVSWRCSGAGGSGCSSSSSSSSAAAAANSPAADRMVEEEIEAAAALADLAHLAMREGCGADSGGDWARGGGKRVKSESPPPAESVMTRCSGPAQDKKMVCPEQSIKACRNVLAEPLKAHDHSEKILKVEKEHELPKTSLVGPAVYSSFGIGKSRRNLTEAEKEARRIRRILANRESARQTIRRRQALSEELTKKAADLALENESLKRVGNIPQLPPLELLFSETHTCTQQCQAWFGSHANKSFFHVLTSMTINGYFPFSSFVLNYLSIMALILSTFCGTSVEKEMEMALKEHQTLQTRNKQLKDQMAKVVKADVEEISGGQKPAGIQITPSSASPMFVYNHPQFPQLFWPPITQTPNSVQASHIPQNEIVMPSNIPFPAEGRHDYCEQDNPINTNGPRTPFYIFTCPWFFPHPDPGASLQSQSSSLQKNEQDETSTNNQYVATSSRTTTHQENQHSFMPNKVKTEPSGLEARTTDDLNELPAEVAQDGGDQETGSHIKGSISKEAVVTPQPIKPVVVTSTIKHVNGLQLDSSSHVKTSAEVCHTPPVTALPEKYCEPILYSRTKSAEAVAAAEARKRRKELTKLKNLHGRQCRMHC